MVGEHLDLSSDPDDSGEPHARAEQGSPGVRPFLGVRFLCCEVYSRIYADEERTAYRGHCPKCAKPVMVRIGVGGSDARFFDVG
jgi:hypothetical protein